MDSDRKCCRCGRAGHLAKDCKWPALHNKTTDALRHRMMDLIEAHPAGVTSRRIMDVLDITDVYFHGMVYVMRRNGIVWVVGRTHVARWVASEDQAQKATAVIRLQKLNKQRARNRRGMQRRREKENEVKAAKPRFPRVSSIFDLANHI